MSLDKLLAQISADPAIASEAVFARLSRLLKAPAPNNSCLLDGAVGPVIESLAAELGLRCAAIGSSGNLGLEVGDQAAPLDLLVSAHMDRPCFRVLSLPDKTLYPLCAVRVPSRGYACDAIGLRCIDGRATLAARGKLHFESAGEPRRIHFEVEAGELHWGDAVMMHRAPRREAKTITGAGLDNAIGLLIALLAARALQRYAGDAIKNRRILFAFTDQEEGPPDGLFGQGAARLAHALEPPRIGFVNVDGHNRDDASGHRPGVGASHAFVSGRGRGSVVPLDYQALAESLADEVNQARPGTVRLNYSYVSRSDDMLLSLWARCVGLVGVVVENAHTTEETASLDDIAAAAHWLPAFIARLLSR